MSTSAPGLVPRWLRGEASDERLVARVRAGDIGAFEQIYDRYERPIRSYCRHLLGQPDDADDAVQHTFIAAYGVLRGGRQEIELKPWLFAVARNRCLSLLRRRRRAPLALKEDAEPTTEGLSVAVERRELVRDLLRDIGGLPEEQRAALILTQLGMLKHDQVAGVLGVPTEKVKALVFQARSSLISTRLARETACDDIRAQLATLTGGGLRRGTLKRHLVDCDGCRDFQLALKRQRAAIVVLLPVAAQPTLRSKVLGEIGAGAGSRGASAGAGSGAGGALGGLLAKGAAIKIGLAVTVAATGVGVATLSGEVRRAFGEDAPRTAAGNVQAPAAASAARALASSAPRDRGQPAARLIRMMAPRRTGSQKPRTSTEDRLVEAPADTTDAGAQQDGPTGTTPSSEPGTTGTGTRPGLARQGGTPPGLPKKGRMPPGLAKKGGTPPGQARPNGTNVPSGQVKKDTPGSTTVPVQGTGSPGNGSGSGNGNPGGGGNAGGSGYGRAH
jgi:RNA polymerase sigma factor (sigma-70 family)